LGELLKWSGSDDVAIMHAGIEFFLHLLKETAYTQSNADLPLYKLAPLLLENLFQVFAHTELSEVMREKLLYLVLQLVKTFSMLDGVQDDVVRECFDETFELWMSIFISALQGSINLNLGIKKYIVKVIDSPCRSW
jgi:importin-9